MNKRQLAAAVLRERRAGRNPSCVLSAAVLGKGPSKLTPGNVTHTGYNKAEVDAFVILRNMVVGDAGVPWDDFFAREHDWFPAIAQHSGTGMTPAEVAMKVMYEMNWAPAKASQRNK